MTAEEKERRKIERILKRKEEKKRRETQKELEKIDREKNQKRVKEITISIEWKKSRMWGDNPHVSGYVSFKNGNSERLPTFTCSGSGYDKESTVIADVFNHYMKYKLWERYNKIKADKENKPYGIYANEYDNIQNVYYGGGIGTSCYYKISEYIGGTFKHVANGKTFDVYKYVDND